MNVEFEQLHISNSIYDKPIYQTGKGKTTLRDVTLEHSDVYMLVYCYQGYYVYFYGL